MITLKHDAAWLTMNGDTYITKEQLKEQGINRLPSMISFEDEPTIYHKVGFHCNSTQNVYQSTLGGGRVIIFKK